MWRRIPPAFLLFLVIVGLTPISSHSQSSESPRRVVTRVTPRYPSTARSMRLSGTVKVEALVAANGTLKSMEIRGGHPLLAMEAQSAVRQWKWEPASHDTHELVEVKFEFKPE
jgi:TonB family protein